MQALATATTNPALFLGLSKTWGCLKAVIGKEDFLLPNEQYVGFRAN
jgi:hypothetical protein